MNTVGAEEGERTQTVAVPAIACANCYSPLSGEYCARCGQRRLGRHTLHGMIGHGLARIFDLDGGFLFTFVRLTVAPGPTVRDYLGGRTAPYTHPLGYLIVAFAIFVLLTSDLTTTGGENRTLTGVVVVFLAAASRLVFLRAGINYAEHLILNLFLFGHLALATSILLLPLQFGLVSPTSSAIPLWLIGITAVSIGYYLWGYAGFFRSRPGSAAAGAAAVLVLGIGSWLLALAYFIRWIQSGGV